MTQFLRALLALVLLAVSCSQAHAETLERVRISLSPTNYAYLPIFLAADLGFFTEQNLDVDITKYNGSSNGQVPLLARGDLDITTVVLGPPIFNQLSSGFDLTLIASLSEAHPKWNGATWLLVRQDVWDSGAIRRIGDLRGKRVDDGNVGTVADLMIREALAANGVAPADVTLTYTSRGPADWYALMRNKVDDVIGAVEPIASELQEQKLAHKWLTYNDVTPWMQDAYFAVSSQYLKAHPDVVRRFLAAILKADKIIDASGGKWTPQLVSEVAKWSQLAPADITRIPGPNYVGEYGTIKTDSVERIQKMLLAAGAVKSPVALDRIIDTTALQAARRATGIK